MAAVEPRPWNRLFQGEARALATDANLAAVGRRANWEARALASNTNRAAVFGRADRETRALAANANDGALGCVMRAIQLMYSMERPKYLEAKKLIDRALELEPGNAMVLAWAAYWHVYYVGQGWAGDGESAKATTKEYAHRAVSIDSNNAEVLAIYGHILSFLHRELRDGTAFL